MKPRLTAQEETELAQRIERGDLSAKHELIERNLGLVGTIASDYRTSSLTKDEAVQIGSLGLIRAAERFDWRKGARFGAFARVHVHAEIQAGLRADRVIAIPDHLTKMKTRAFRAETTLQTRLGRQPTDEEIKAESKLSSSQFETVRNLPYSTALPGSHSHEDNEDERTSAVLAESDSEELEINRDGEDSHPYIELGERALEVLPADERAVILLRFGNEGTDGLPLADISTELGIPFERVRAIEARALRRLDYMLTGETPEAA